MQQSENLRNTNTNSEGAYYGTGQSNNNATAGNGIVCIPPQDENFQPQQQHHQNQNHQLLSHARSTATATTTVTSSPLSLVSTELKLSDNSRIRKPIYISQSNDSRGEPRTLAMADLSHFL